MDKWDNLVILLKENYLEEFTSRLYAAEGKNKTQPMKQTILEVARRWRLDKPLEGKEIISQIIETVTIGYMEEQNALLLSKNEELSKVSKDIETEKSTENETLQNEK